jgi:hypothetical protein
MVEYLGWAATAVFVASYFCTRAAAMRRIQMLGALMWTAYGVFMHASPVVVANLLVFLAAAWTARPSLRGRAAGALDGSGRP